MSGVLLKYAIASTLAVFAGAAIATVGAYGCTPLKANGDHRPSDAGPDPSGCAHKQPPARPDVVRPDGGLDLTFAVQTQYTGTSSFDDAGAPAYLGIGWDMDDTCTGEGQGPSCVEPPWVTQDAYNDVEAGIDNALGKLYGTRYVGAPDLVTVTLAGPGVALIRVRGYSGDDDDDQVEVSWYTAMGLEPREDGGTEGGAVPLWDGEDRWSIRRETLMPLSDGGYSVDQPLATDPKAYVSHKILVAHVDEALGGARLPLSPYALLPLKKLVVAGPLVQLSDGSWELPRLEAGSRTQINDALWVMARFQDPSDPNGKTPLCQTAPHYEAIRTTACSFLDISSGDDSAQLPCDALSGSSVVSAKPARLGSIAPPAPDSLSCPPDVHPEIGCDSSSTGD
jgi:hypothetical protein